jgi:hypothetical protein
MVKNSKNSTKNMMCILLVIFIIVIIVSLLYLFYKRNKSYEGFIGASYHSSTTNTKSPITHLKGTYVTTCNNVKYTDNTYSMISASCRNKKGKSTTSTLSVICNDNNGISNCDGKLKCGKC